MKMATDTTERALERLICRELAGHSCDPPAEGAVAESPAGYGGVGWTGGSFHDYDREYCVDLVQVAAFLRDTQPEAADALALSEDGPTRRAFLTRLQGEIAKRGTIDVLRNGIRHRALHLDLFYGTPSVHNARGAGAVRAEPVHGYPAASLQPGRGAAVARHRVVHQRAAGFHVRVEEQPHQADGG